MIDVEIGVGRLAKVGAWLVAGSTVALWIAIPFLEGSVSETLTDPVGLAAGLLLVLGLTGLGLVVVVRKGNLIGWILLTIGWLWTASGMLLAVAGMSERGLVDQRLGSWAGWLGAMLFGPPLALLVAVLLPLLFPTGRLLSPRWAPVLWLALVTLAVFMAEFFDSELWDDSIDAEGLSYPLPRALPPAVTSVMLELLAPALLAILLVAVLVNIVIRFRRSTGVERQQFKWVAVPAVAMVMMGLFYMVDIALSGSVELITHLSGFLWFVGFLGLPVGVAMALLRYRLYDIDRIISRTVSYAIVVALLVSVFLALIVSVQALLPAQNDLAVAASTLAVAALFNPLRKRVQGLVDRRFNRSRYDAQREIDRLAGRLRQAHDQAEVASEMIDVVTKTMQPSAVGVWVRDV